MNRRLLFVILIGFTVASLAACGSGSSNPTQIAFNVAPPADLQVSATTSISATVFNNNNTGVNWTVTCSSADCGSFNPTSGTSTVYTAPTMVPTGNTVTITATAAASSSVTVMATVTITTSGTGTALNGQYAFMVSGQDANGAYVAAGSVVADGNGNITGGEEDLCDFSGCSTGVLSGTFSTGSDGRGSINVSSTAIGSQTFNIVLTSSGSHALIIEFDSGATSSGTLDLQDPTALSQGGAAITGGYAFAVNGVDGNSVQSALGGILSADGAGGFSNGVSLDVNEGGSISTDDTAWGVVSAPDSFGRAVVSDSQLEFVYYIVSAKALRFIEADENVFLTSGSAYTEGSTSPSGGATFTEAGGSGHGTGALGVAGQMTISNGSASSGFIDVNDGGTVSNGSIAGSSFGAFASGRGTLSLGGSVSSDVTQFDVYLVDPSVNILDPTNASGGGGALLLDSDTNAVGIGEIIPQTSGTQFSGNYGLNLQAFESTNNGTAENDLEGQVAAASSALNGNGDLNNSGNNLPAEALSGSFTADSNNPGRFTGSLTVGSFGTFNLVYYQASSSQIVIVEVDSGQQGTGTLLTQ